MTGGGDFFESETIFRPTAVPCSEPYFIDDFVDSVNQYRKASGMPGDYLVFHDGCFLSAIRLSDQKIVTLDETNGVSGVFLDLNDWYVKTLRDLFADEYDLPTG